MGEIGRLRFFFEVAEASPIWLLVVVLMQGGHLVTLREWKSEIGEIENARIWLIKFIWAICAS